MKKLEQLYEGKAKKVFATDEDGVVIVDYKDDATAFNGGFAVSERFYKMSGNSVLFEQTEQMCIRDRCNDAPSDDAIAECKALGAALAAV